MHSRKTRRRSCPGPKSLSLCSIPEDRAPSQNLFYLSHRHLENPETEFEDFVSYRTPVSLENGYRLILTESLSLDSSVSHCDNVVNGDLKSNNENSAFLALSSVLRSIVITTVVLIFATCFSTCSLLVCHRLW